MTAASLSSEYHVWVLRLWRESSLAPWRITLESVVTHEREGFADLNELLTYLQFVWVSEVPPKPRVPPEPADPTSI